MSEKTTIFLSPPHLSGEFEKSYIEQALDDNWVAPIGPNLDAFEEDLSSYFNGEMHAVALNSGTAALHLALILLGVKRDDVVLCQSFTFAASANPIAYLGARPMFIDSESTSWNICPDLLEKAIKTCLEDNILPKAIIAVDLYGMPYQIDEVSKIAKTYGIPIIEDSAEALGSSYKGRPCGAHADFSIFSFNGNKIITTSGGGALLTKRREDKAKALYLATQAKQPFPYYEHLDIGYNYRMSNILAGIGRAQLKVIYDRVGLRRRNFEYYKTRLGDFKNIEFLKEPQDCFSNRWLTCIVLENYETREAIRKELLINNIESRPLWKPMHLQPVYSGNRSFTNGVSATLFEKGLCLPSGSNLTDQNLEFITEIIIKVLRYNGKIST